MWMCGGGGEKGFATCAMQHVTVCNNPKGKALRGTKRGRDGTHAWQSSDTYEANVAISRQRRLTCIVARRGMFTTIPCNAIDFMVGL